MADQWQKAKPPNYKTNKDKLYPYSELPCLTGLNGQLLKIPLCVKNLIEHVDYIGEGRIETSAGTRGFSDCYNANYEYRLVEGGPDDGRRIPNRIPLDNDTGTGSYIKDNSVLTVTVNLDGRDLIKIGVTDIARIVNSERGKVIVYGYDMNSFEMLCDELRRTKQLFYCPIYLLPEKLRLTYWKTCYRAYLGVKELKRELYLYVYKGDFEAAVIMTGCLNDTLCGGALGDVVNKLLQNKVGNVIAYAYKLWNSNYKEVVCEHFPSVFQHIFGGHCMDLNNKLNNQALILEPKTTKARGDGNYRSSKKLGWKMIPIWDDNKVFFKLYNIDSAKYLQLSPTVGDDGVREARGKNDSEEQADESERFSFSPLIMENGQVAFNILNCEDNKQLSELPVDVDSSEVKAVVGEKSVGSVQDGRSCWILTTSDESVKRNDQSADECEDEQSDECEDGDFSNISN